MGRLFTIPVAYWKSNSACAILVVRFCGIFKTLHLGVACIKICCMGVLRLCSLVLKLI